MEPISVEVNIIWSPGKIYSLLSIQNCFQVWLGPLQSVLSVTIIIPLQSTLTFGNARITLWRNNVLCLQIGVRNKLSLLWIRYLNAVINQGVILVSCAVEWFVYQNVKRIIKTLTPGKSFVDAHAFRHCDDIFMIETCNSCLVRSSLTYSMSRWLKENVRIPSKEKKLTKQGYPDPTLLPSVRLVSLNWSSAHFIKIFKMFLVYK